MVDSSDSDKHSSISLNLEEQPQLSIYGEVSIQIGIIICLYYLSIDKMKAIHILIKLAILLKGNQCNGRMKWNK